MKLADSNGSTNHIVPFSNGALRAPHVDRIGPAFPLFLKLEDMVTAGDGTDGLVWGGRPVTDQSLANELGKHRKTIAAWRRRHQEWRRHFVVENVQRSTNPFGVFVPNFFCAAVRAGLQKGIQESFLVRTSPPAAKLGAGVEKSPGPSLFYGFSAS